MAGRRMISDKICESEKLAKVTPWAERLWYRLLSKTDDSGNFHASPALVRGFCLPLFDVTLAEVQGWLDELAGVGLIQYYMVGSDKLLYIADFLKYQKLRKDRVPTIKHPAHPESFDTAAEQQPETELDEIEDDSENSGMPVIVQQPKTESAPTEPAKHHSALILTPTVKNGNHLATIGMPEVKLSEVKSSQVNPNTRTHGTFSTGDWSNIRKLHKRLLDKKPDKAFNEHRYTEACKQYGEEIVLVCFEEWAVTSKEWASTAKNPLAAFFKRLPELAAEEQASRADDDAERERIQQEAKRQQANDSATEQLVAKQKQADWEFMNSEPPPENGGSALDYLAEIEAAEQNPKGTDESRN